MNRLAFAVVLLLVLFPAQSRVIGQQNLAADAIQWRPVGDTALAESATTNRPAMILFSAKWCSPCQDLKRFVLADRQVIQQVNRDVIPVLAEADDHPDLLKQYQVTSLPMAVFVDGQGRLLMKMNAPQSAAEWSRMLDQAKRTTAVFASQSPEASEQVRDLQQQWQARRETVVDKDGEVVEEFSIEPFHMQKFGSKLDSAPGVETPAELSVAGAAAATREQYTSSRFARPAVAESGDGGSGVVPGIGDTRSLHAAATISTNSPNVLRKAEAGPDSIRIANPHLKEQPAAEPARELASAPSSTTAAQVSTPPSGDSSNPPVAGDIKPASDRGIETTVSLKAEVKSRPSQPVTVVSEFGLDGHCPVTLLRDGKWQKGNSRIGCNHRGRIYLFASPEELQTFLADPDKWSPMLAGFDPVEFAEKGAFVNGRREYGLFMSEGGNQVVVLFANEENQAKFKSGAASFIDSVKQAKARADAGVEKK